MYCSSFYEFIKLDWWFPSSGAEAPRNSLELEECEAAIPEDYYGVPVSIQIAIPPAMSKKKKGGLLPEDERKRSQVVTPRTRSIVARLMGLEVFEDEESPSSTFDKAISSVTFSAPNLSTDSNESSEKKKKKRKKQEQPLHKSSKDKPVSRRPLLNLNTNISGSLSLPDTPRASSERARDAEPRFSLQFNREDSSYGMQELGSCLREPYRDCSSSLHPSKSSKKYSFTDENAFPRNENLARERVIQMRRNIHKRERSFGSNENVLPSRRNIPIESKYVKKNSYMKQLKTLTVLKPPPTFSSPKPVLSKPKEEVPKPSLKLLKPKAAEARALKMEPGKCRKPEYERFTEKIKLQNSQLTRFKEEESMQTGILPLKKEQEPLKHHFFRAKKHDPEFKYVKAILARADVERAKSMKWFSLSLPIDPTIFHILEFGFPSFESNSRETKNVEEATARLGPLQHRWNRKLLFHLVEEILGDLLISEPRRWSNRSDTEQLLSRLWSQIRSFPAALCRVVGDIDSLVAGDLPVSKLRRLHRHPLVVDEAQEIAAEIERNILDSLLGEAAESMGLIYCSSQVVPRS